MKTVFVILHFLTDNDTIECIESLNKNIGDENFDIVIVDNFSNNGSLEKLMKKYNGNKRIYFIKASWNMGFAKGNNKGFDFAKKSLNADFIVLLNNDTIIEQNDFLGLVYEKYIKSSFDILGPDIISLKDGIHQNPVKASYLDISRLYKKIFLTRLLIVLNRIGILNIISIIFKALKKFIVKKEIDSKNICNKEIENVQLHGSCLIFSPKYIERFKGLFSKTFMYGEEDILFYISKKENLKTIYWPEIKIYHKEDSSTDVLLKKGKEKRDFVYRNSLESLKLLQEIHKDNNLYIEDMYEKK